MNTTYKKPPTKTNHSSLYLKELLAILLRTKKEPIPYIIEQKHFWVLNLKLSNNAFMPRLDTECLIEQALNLLPNNKLNVLDLGTGSGTIVLSLAYERNKWNHIGTDFSLNALTIAKYNTNNLNLKTLKTVSYIFSNWFNSLYLKRYGLIISNPPYVSKKDLHLNKGYIHIEPTISLASSNNGLHILFKICISSIFFLTYGGWLLLEHGYKQGSIARSFLLSLSFKDVHSIKDYNNERITIGRML